MTDYLLTAKKEVLYEKVFGTLAKYASYLRTEQEPLDCIKVLYESLKLMPDKIILCDTNSDYIKYNRDVDEYEKIINSVLMSVKVGA